MQLQMIESSESMHPFILSFQTSLSTRYGRRIISETFGSDLHTSSFHVIPITSTFIQWIGLQAHMQSINEDDEQQWRQGITLSHRPLHLKIIGHTIHSTNTRRQTG